MAMPSQITAEFSNTLSRRSFLGVAASFAGGSLLPPLRDAVAQPSLRVPPGLPPSRVVQAREPYLVNGPDVHRNLLGEVLDKILTSLTGTSTVEQAWRTILKPDDVIGLKFNRSGQAVIGTTGVVAEVLIESIVQAGWDPSRIVCIELPPEAAAKIDTKAARQGYDPRPINFGSGTDQFAAVLNQVTALISVPFLKTHNIAGLTCSLKNLSHGLIKHPARYHKNGCSPYIADIVAAAPIRSKLRLCLVDALRPVYDGGPKANATTISDEGVLLASIDPVATDAVALTVLNETRGRRGLGQVADTAAEIGYLAAAHERGLGIAVKHGIEVIRV